MTNDLTAFATKGEATAARKLIRALLARELSVSVNDGEEWTVHKSRNYREIVDALCTTGVDYVRGYAPTGDSTGTFTLIYGNDEDGSELIADHTDNLVCNSAYKAVYGVNA